MQGLAQERPELRGQELPVPLRVPAATDTVVLELEGDPAILPL